MQEPLEFQYLSRGCIGDRQSDDVCGSVEIADDASHLCASCTDPSGWATAPRWVRCSPKITVRSSIAVTFCWVDPSSHR
jgi:hypothetical protein